MEENNNNSSSSSTCGSIEAEPILQPQEQDLMDPKEDFGMFGDDGMKSSSTSPLEDALLADPDSCGMCGETLVVPRVLSCLHVFCEHCLDRKLMGVDGGGGDAGSPDTSITCPTCNQETKVGTLKLAALPLDITHISTSFPPLPPTTSPTSPATTSDSPPLTPPIGPATPSAIGTPPPSTAQALLCTSCTTRECAVAKCETCLHLLCANCDKAHRYMRLFETHRVHTLSEEDLLSGSSSITHLTGAGGDGANTAPAPTGSKGKVGICEVHAGHEAVWYCATCGVLCCGSCGAVGSGIEEGGGEGKTRGMHAGHQLESVQECESRIRRELDVLLADARAQSQHLQAASASSSEVGSFEELAHQRTVAKDLITETCHSYKAVLERCRDKALDELHTMYRERELKLMDMTEKVGKDISSLDDACRFTSKLLSNGTISDILYLRRIVITRLQHLVRSTGRLEQCYSLEFRTDLKQFEHIARKAFGYVVTERDGMDCDGLPSPGIVGELGGLIGKLPNNMMAQHPGAPISPSTNHLHHNAFALTNGGTAITGHSSNSIGTGSVHSNTSPINSLPTTTSMQSSFDGTAELQVQVPGQTGGGFLQTQQNQQMALAAAHAVARLNGSSPSPIVGSGSGGAAGANGIQGFSSIAEYNLAQLASLAENSSAPGSIASATSPNPGAASGHGNAPFIADMFQNDTVFKNLQSLAKLGLGNEHAHGPNALNNSHPHGLTNGHHHHHPSNMLLPSNGQHPHHHHHARSISPGGSSTAGGSTISINTQMLVAAAAAAAAAGGSVSAASSPLLPGSGGTPDVGAGGEGGVGAEGGAAGTNGAIARVNKVCPMQIRCKFGQLGATKGQFNSPHGFCLGLEEDIVVADTNNHRIQIFEKTGTFKFQFGLAGKDEGQLWYPRKVAVMRGCGKYVVCDRGNERSRMQIFTKNGHFLKKIAIRYIDIVAGLAVTAQGEIVAVDSVSPTVFVISENGDLLRWFDCSDYMREPSDIAIHERPNTGKEFYVCDFKGHNVVVFSEDGAFKRRIGWEAITSYPNGIDISDAGDVLIGDSHGNRFHVAVFSRDGPLISEFECPYVKVSRCCGLKITSEGYVVTLAKNNHHVLVLNTLYIL